MTEAAKKTLIVNCPKCKVKHNYYDSEFRPFCSDRCQTGDQAMWAEEGYSIPVKPSSDFEDEGGLIN